MNEKDDSIYQHARLFRKNAEEYLRETLERKQLNKKSNTPTGEIQLLTDPPTGCTDTSQRRLFWQQGRPWYLLYAIRARDGGMVAVGATLDIDSAIDQWDVFPFIIKFNAGGDVLWNRQLRGDVNGEMDLQALYEMADGSILAAGDMQTKQRVSVSNPREYDALIVKISPLGELVWSKTFASTVSVCYNGTGLFIKDFAELPGGDLVVSGTAYNCPSPMIPVVMRLTSAGNLVWSRSFGEGNPYFLRSQGLFVSADQISLICIEAEAIWKIDMPLNAGGNISFRRVGYDYEDYSNRLNTLIGDFSTRIIRLNNGNYRIVSATVASFTTSWRDTSSIFGVLDLSENFVPVQYRLLNSNTKTNFDYHNNQFITLQPNGRIDAGMFEYISGYTGNYFFAQFAPDGGDIKQRMLRYKGVGMPTSPFLLPEFNGEQNFIQTYYDSTQEQFFMENTRLHFSDTASACLGQDTVVFFWGKDKYKVLPNTFNLKVFDTTIFSTPHTVWQDTLLMTDLFDGCKQVNYCDSLSITPPINTVCRSNQVLTLNAYKNKACGQWVQWRAQFPEKMQVTVKGAKSAEIKFLGNYDGWLFAEMQGNCKFLKDSIRFTVTQLPDPLTLGSDTVICPGNLITLKATQGYIAYQWNTGATGDSLTIAAPGKYWVMARDACGEVSTDTLVVKDYKTGFFSAGENNRICPGESLTLQATPGYSNYKWSPDSSMQNGLTANPTVRPSKTTTYFVTAEERPGCFVADTVMVMVESDNPFSLGPDFNICKGESRLIIGPDGFATYLWNTGIKTRDLKVENAGTYILEAISIEGCPQRDTLVLQSLHDLPMIKLDKDSILCAGETKTYSSVGNYASYLWSNGSSNPTLTVNQTGLYWLQVEDNNGCRGSDSAEITRVEPLPTDFLPGDSTICNFDSWQLNPLKNFTAYLWNTGATTPGITIKDAGNYRLVVTNADGCKGTDDVNVSVKKCTEGLFVPTAFTPNSDGTNDTFKGMLFGNIVSFDFRIFNRFGEVVFVSNDTQKGWNGFHNNKPQPAGTFIWNCRYQLQGQPIKVQKGSFILIR